MKRKVIIVSIATLAAFVVATGFIAATSFAANNEESDQIKVEITGTFNVGDSKFVRFADTEAKVVCYMQKFTGSVSCVKQSMF